MSPDEHIVVDELVCEGAAVCEMLAPTIFQVGDDDVVSVRRQPDDDVTRAEAAEAVDRCPKQALRLMQVV
ncbi:ferredoxin [Nocardioides humi]|uniref:Ferredoxin n=1 Tax=Nocardioides humi TaxID=449461 RepID=A0ABN2AFL6_9ACTN|nr:ferredoxin [Nocardioides humi]